MKNNIFQIFIFVSAIVICQKINAQTTSAGSIIFSNIVFLRTENTESNSGPVHNGYATQAITYYKNDYYSFKITVKINESVEAPLDVKLIPPKGKEKIYRLQKNIKLLWKDEFYDYNLEIILQETGWYRLEIGDFSNHKNGVNTNIVFDERGIYVNK